MPTMSAAPLAKRLHLGRSWDEVRAYLQGREVSIDGIERVRVLDLYIAIKCASKAPSQKLETYSKDTCLGLRAGVDDIQMWHLAPSRSKPPYWLS